MATNDERFKFGKNWSRFLSVLNDERILEAERSLIEMLAIDKLEGKTFLDIGSGSGIFSLCAVRLGALKVHSFDCDPQSVACTQELKKRYFNYVKHWVIEEGSVLDNKYLSKLGQWDVVYSWGVLHHTGAMWQALGNVASLVKRGGKLYIAIYNRQRLMTPVWTKIKKTYVKSNSFIKLSILIVFITYFALRGFLFDLIQLHNPISRYKNYKTQRGMHIFYDWIDWIGGYPFDTAKPEEIIEFLRHKGFILDKLKTQFGTSACNEYVFSKVSNKTL
jgi:2-polyprenyl-6-hydroxyphenyl methylase/3-demethylubiquinone-9 3-methyltransferase